MPHTALFFAVAALAGGLLGMAWPLPEPGVCDTSLSEEDPARIDALLRGWPETPRSAAEDVLALLGPPDGATATELAWNGRGRREHVFVFRDPIRALTGPARSRDHVLQIELGPKARPVP